MAERFFNELPDLEQGAHVLAFKVEQGIDVAPFFGCGVSEGLKGLHPLDQVREMILEIDPLSGTFLLHQGVCLGIVFVCIGRFHRGLQFTQYGFSDDHPSLKKEPMPTFNDL